MRNWKIPPELFDGVMDFSLDFEEIIENQIKRLIDNGDAIRTFIYSKDLSGPLSEDKTPEQLLSGAAYNANIMLKAFQSNADELGPWRKPVSAEELEIDRDLLENPREAALAMLDDELERLYFFIVLIDQFHCDLIGGHAWMFTLFRMAKEAWIPQSFVEHWFNVVTGEFAPNDDLAFQSFFQYLNDENKVVSTLDFPFDANEHYTTRVNLVRAANGKCSQERSNAVDLKNFIESNTEIYWDDKANKAALAFSSKVIKDGRGRPPKKQQKTRQILADAKRKFLEKKFEGKQITLKEALEPFVCCHPDQLENRLKPLRGLLRKKLTLRKIEFK